MALHPTTVYEAETGCPAYFGDPTKGSYALTNEYIKWAEKRNYDIDQQLQENADDEHFEDPWYESPEQLEKNKDAQLLKIKKDAGTLTKAEWYATRNTKQRCIIWFIAAAICAIPCAGWLASPLILGTMLYWEYKRNP